MNRLQFLAFCATAFAGCFLGGFMAQIGPGRALAQYQTFPPQPVNPGQVNIRSDNTLFVPEGGLRMVNAQNRTLGVITDQGGNGGIVLLNNQGRPSVSMMAGQAGFVDISANGTPGLRLVSPNGKDGVVLSATDANSTLKLRQGLTLTSANDGGRISVIDARSNTGLRLDTYADGGRITGYEKTRNVVFELLATGDDATINLSKKDGGTGFTASGSGTAAIRKDKETLWKIPTDGGSDR